MHFTRVCKVGYREKVMWLTLRCA